MFFFFFKQKTAYEMRISDWSSCVCSSDLLVSYFAGRGEPVALTYRQMGELVDKLALRLLELGIGAREFVSCQFPNRWEFAIAHLATIRIGAISSAIMPIYGKREVRFMLERTGSRGERKGGVEGKRG